MSITADRFEPGAVLPSMDYGYSQYMRKYRILITKKSARSVTFITKVDDLDGTDDRLIPSQSLNEGTITGKKVNVRKEPSKTSKSYGTLKKGAKVTVYAEKDGWYQINFKKGADGKGWVLQSYVKMTVERLSGISPFVKLYGGAEAGTEEAERVREQVTTVTDKVTIDVSNLRCTFMCEKSLNDTPNYSQIVVYNPSQDTISSIKAGDVVILEAGYENGNYGMIFAGQIVQPYTMKEDGTDIALYLICQDGDEFLNRSFVMQTVKSSASQEDVLQACIGDVVDRGIINSGLSIRQLVRGKVLFGKPSTILSQIASSNQGQFYLEDGKVNIVAAADYASNEAVELNPNTGLIGMPSQTDDGVSGQCLINPSIKLNTLIYINQSLVAQKQVGEGETEYSVPSADGVYRVIKLTYEGDTRGEPWYCNFEAVAQSGMYLDGLTNDDTNPWR